MHIYLNILNQSCHIQNICPMVISPYTLNFIGQPVSGNPVMESYFHQNYNRIKLFHFICKLFGIYRSRRCLPATRDELGPHFSPYVSPT